MRSTVPTRPSAALLVLPLVGLLLVACSGTPSSPPGGLASGGPAGIGSTPPSPAGSRPASPAVVTIQQPAPNAVITGTSIHVVLTLVNATIVPATTTNLRPDQGHLHLYVDGVLVSMNYGLEQDLPVKPGTYSLKAEFVAADHAPFDPRVWSPQIVFTVK
jgi:hypothetical protein